MRAHLLACMLPPNLLQFSECIQDFDPYLVHQAAVLGPLPLQAAGEDAGQGASRRLGEQPLGLGEPADGFYWHVRAAAPSPARLSRCEGGAEGIMEAAARVAAEVAEGVAAGCFPPRPPAEGCPPYCPAAGFCWHLRPRRG